MLVECRFCLEEVETIDNDECNDQLNECNDNGKKNEEILLEELERMETLNRKKNGGYVELTPITQSKRQRKNHGNKLVRPCDCKGTQRYVHVKCLCEWIGKSNKWYCSICHRVYNLSPHHLHYCVMRLQRKGVLKNLPPIYSSSEFSRSSYFALLIFMGTLSMLMLPSTLPNQNYNSRYYSTNNMHSTTIGNGIIPSSFYSINHGNSGVISFNPASVLNSDTTTAGYNPFPNSGFNFYPSSSSPSIYVSSTQQSSVSSTTTSTSSEKKQQQSQQQYESNFEPYFNSQISSIFSSCKLKNQDEKFSSFVCHSSPYSSSNLLNSHNNPTNQLFSFHFPTIVKSTDSSNNIIDAMTQQQQDESILKNFNYIHNIQNYQPTTTTSATTNTIPTTTSSSSSPSLEIQLSDNNQPKSTSKSPILNNLGPSNNLDHGIQLQNIYIAHQKYHRVSILDSLKNIFCHFMPIRQFCY